MQFLKDWMISISSDLYEEILEVKSLRGFKKFTVQVAVSREKQKDKER